MPRLNKMQKRLLNVVKTVSKNGGNYGFPCRDFFNSSDRKKVLTPKFRKLLQETVTQINPNYKVSYGPGWALKMPAGPAIYVQDGTDYWSIY